MRYRGASCRLVPSGRCLLLASHVCGRGGRKINNNGPMLSAHASRNKKMIGVGGSDPDGGPLGVSRYYQLN